LAHVGAYLRERCFERERRGVEDVSFEGSKVREGLPNVAERAGVGERAGCATIAAAGKRCRPIRAQHDVVNVDAFADELSPRLEKPRADDAIDQDLEAAPCKAPGSGGKGFDHDGVLAMRLRARRVDEAFDDGRVEVVGVQAYGAFAERGLAQLAGDAAFPGTRRARNDHHGPKRHAAI